MEILIAYAHWSSLPANSAATITAADEPDEVFRRPPFSTARPSRSNSNAMEQID
ncbi:hypothetical protein RISK_004941 [Rhodopirellula islandica]|uniref:Uncharacterized protein n=1 Tax=Rhodopirellula islandica TaxID=595434 RepID=A0A0J1B943_RHOIS|nr:hypothetical protein RISK_004941 [Rhodopirellula islandica]